MAALENHYDSILTERKGENVRDAIIKAAKALKLYANNAETLGGTPASDFLPSSEYWQLWEDVNKELASAVASDFENDSDIRPGGTKSRYLVTSGEIYNIFDNYVRPSLVAILKYEIDPISDKPMKEAINYYLNEMNKAKEQMAVAIKAKGGSIKKDASLADFATEINGIANDKVIETEPKSVDQNNQTIDANEEHNRKPTDPHYAYSKVTANIRPNYKTLSINQNDVEYTIDAESKKEPWNDPIEGFNSVTVNVPNGKSSSTSSRASRSTGKKGVVVTDEDIMSSKEITDKSSHTASEDNVKGWASVTVNVELEPIKEGDTFKVEFVVDGNIIDTQEVHPYERARCTAEFETTKEQDGTTYVFSGWSPPPISVISDMTCVAGWRPAKASETEEISDSWTTIISNAGAPYDIGKYKKLPLGNNKGTLYMQKVFEGEDGTTSTWISMNCMPAVTGGAYGVYYNWWHSAEREYLNNGFFTDLLASSGDAKALAEYIQPVLKRSIGYCEGELGFAEIETFDRVWVPSLHEISGVPSSSVINNLIECSVSGIDPKTKNRAWTRNQLPWYYSYICDFIGNEKENTTAHYGDVYGSASWEYDYDVPDPMASSGGGPNHSNIHPVFDSDKVKKKDLGYANDITYMLRSVHCGPSTTISHIYRPLKDAISDTGEFTTIQQYAAIPIGFCL